MSNSNIKSLDYRILKELLSVKSPSGEEDQMKQFIIKHFTGKHWNSDNLEIIDRDNIQDCLMIRKGTPKVAVFAHMDTVGFTARYENQLLPVGSPEIINNTRITGSDQYGPIDCLVKIDHNGKLFHDFKRPVIRGTSLVFKPDFKDTMAYIQSPCLDNRIGLFISILLAENISDALFVFTCWEEHGGGSVPYLLKTVVEDFKITQSLICDVTWITEGILPGKGTVISLRDRYVPRRKYIEKILSLASGCSAQFQLEVEGEGSSDGGEIQRSPYPVDWCFIGPPVENTHSPKEKVYKKDIISTIELYQFLIEHL
jgi:putative aminopeptidase FrvX